MGSITRGIAAYSTGNKTKSGRLYRRLKRLLFSAGVFCFSLAAIPLVMINMPTANIFDSSHAERLMRIDFNTLVANAEQGRLGGNEKAEYALFDEGGRVLKSTVSAYRVGDVIDLHTLNGLNGIKDIQGKAVFTSPVITGGRMNGLLLVYADKAAYAGTDTMTAIMCILVLLLAMGATLTLVCAVQLLKNDLFKPISLLHNSTLSISHGDMDARLFYDDNTEVGSLCHDFEAMRDELAASLRRESELMNNERLLLACISHDLKTPLAAISGYAEEIRDGMADSGEHRAALSRSILKKVRLLTKLIDDILEETKAQLGELSIVTQELYARNFFEEVCGELSLDAAHAGLTFTVNEIPDVLINIDAKRITQVMQNLISNSIKYTGSGGKIEVCFSDSGNSFMVCVKDNGRGIAAADLPFVFDRFFRGDTARAQDIPGSGLGLCIAKNIIERHGGKIECDSVLGSGTEVCFTLPL